MIQQDLMSIVMKYAPNFYVDVRFPRWVNSEHSRIECEVNFKHVGFEEYTVFCADPDDVMPYSKEIFERCAAGEFGPVAEYIAPSATEIPAPAPSTAAPSSGDIPQSVL